MSQLRTKALNWSHHDSIRSRLQGKPNHVNKGSLTPAKEGPLNHHGLEKNTEDPSEPIAFIF